MYFQGIFFASSLECVTWYNLKTVANNRAIYYLIVIALAIVSLAAIKKLTPHHEPPKPKDLVGMKLFEPLFFGKSFKSVAPKEAQTFKDEPTFSDSAADKTASESKAEVSTPVKTTTEKPKKPAVKTATKSTSTSNADIFEQMLADYKANVLTKRKYRNDVVVRYYKHEPDGDNADVLVDYGFYLHVREVVNKDRYKNLMSNVIYYGHEFPESDLRLITYLLVQSGIEIKAVRKFQDFDGWKRKAIEIGGDPKLASKSPMTLDQIRNIRVPE